MLRTALLTFTCSLGLVQSQISEQLDSLHRAWNSSLPMKCMQSVCSIYLYFICSIYSYAVYIYNNKSQITAKERNHKSLVLVSGKIMYRGGTFWEGVNIYYRKCDNHFILLSIFHICMQVMLVQEQLSL